MVQPLYKEKVTKHPLQIKTKTTKLSPTTYFKVNNIYNIKKLLHMDKIRMYLISNLFENNKNNINNLYLYIKGFPL